MNPISNQTILAIDLGKYKSVACIYRSADDQQFTVATLPQDGLNEWATRRMR
jgi:hypothetical protein